MEIAAWVIEPTDWAWGLGGGLLIGLAASIFLLGSGRVMGASGILGSVVDGTAGNRMIENLAFIIGLVVTPFVMNMFVMTKPTNATDNIVLLVLAGLLVGYGTRMANGCTSGHGVCGMSRFSLRGIAATGVYLLFGGLTMFIGRHVLGVI